jgi:DNA-binding protein H-NS
VIAPVVIHFRSSCYPGEIPRCTIVVSRPSLLDYLSENEMKPADLPSMSVDQLWNLHEEIVALLSTKMEAEKRELEQRLAELQRVVAKKPKPRRSYPKVLPKYRNPDRPSETWSGRGKQPHWVSTHLRLGKKVDELLIVQTH